MLPDTLQRLQKELLQLTTVLTLGISEAVLLLKEAGGYSHREVSNLDDLVCLSKALHALGPEYVLVKGDGIPLLGSSEVSECGFVKELAINVLYDGIDVSVFKTAHAALRTPQGAGSALACMSSIPEAISFPNSKRVQLQSPRTSPLKTPCR